MTEELTIPLASGASLNLHMSKKADKEFIGSLVCLIRSIRRAMHMHQDLFGIMKKPAELIRGSFDGIKVLEEGYGTEGVTRKEWSYSLLQLQRYSTPYNPWTKVLQQGYGTEGVTIKEWSYSLLQLQRYSTPYNPCTKPSARWLEGTTGLPNSKDVAEGLLVRRTLAWVTGIILLVAAIMGDNDSAEDEINHDGNSEMICVKSFKAFRLLNACR
ncbi:uncharacterized protein LOC131300423 isoform X1 [Rhododendron vialii]|uniref:uncharacterized protein LOC131300423 isoform X1 n=1 Tax=Rhododendron vialii TaxID=182163 RepID=UPI00265F4D52|nr:uncharacterized protein LOC131300423 isoform X1 [Rhododendron vialii]XP_058182246.1 uncharacterized protein LOC131300423 isoform X1 [Rhododendron vialii]XP_058182247.1 uncharacterized protein LOC131300423 isoform X1 [Rhododendron vialii]XP_058182248.1 uncharacterized protein LOC131300423 isoform X1 [Rhododendron vialii]XP_058182249.1 uncharacterized protein LOC131300423 isoform X1 [Rhododendron vialii]XP_058182250.1 uncharacterized protein LOC131300423 isoform X1 [Rhododendron vialii]XP_05